MKTEDAKKGGSVEAAERKADVGETGDPITEIAGKDNDYLVMKLSDPVTFGGKCMQELDIRKLREMTGRELNIIYDLYSAQGGSAQILQESTLLFAQVIASRVCGLPLEAILELKAKDSMRLKNRVYRFFFLSE